jgi:hypothetical protein
VSPRFIEKSPITPNTADNVLFLARVLRDNPEAKDALLSDQVPYCDDAEQTLAKEIALRSLEMIDRPPGVQLVDENNVILNGGAPHG